MHSPFVEITASSSRRQAALSQQTSRAKLTQPWLEWKPVKLRVLMMGLLIPAGRFWAGTLEPGRSPSNALYCLYPDGTVQQKESGIRVSNGIGWSPDAQTMYFVDTPTKIIFAYDYEIETGAISKRRAFVDTNQQPGYPDGLTVDIEGCVWCAYWDGWRVVRYDPSGQQLFEISMPVARPTACTFGGEDLNILYITSARVNLSSAELNQQPEAGNLFAYETSTTGIAPTSALC